LRRRRCSGAADHDENRTDFPHGEHSAEPGKEGVPGPGREGSPTRRKRRRILTALQFSTPKTKSQGGFFKGANNRHEIKGPRHHPAEALLHRSPPKGSTALLFGSESLGMTTVPMPRRFQDLLQSRIPGRP